MENEHADAPPSKKTKLDDIEKDVDEVDEVEKDENNVEKDEDEVENEDGVAVDGAKAVEPEV